MYLTCLWRFHCHLFTHAAKLAAALGFSQLLHPEVHVQAVLRQRMAMLPVMAES